MQAVVVALVVFFGMDSMGSAQTRQTEHTWKLDEGSAPLAAELSAFDWLVGRWVGTGLGGECEEDFLPPWHDSMTGSFHYVQEGKLVFSEFFSLVQQDGGLVLKLRHFHPDFTGWEEKDQSVQFPLIKVKPNIAHFGWVTYQRGEAGVLNVWVAMHNHTTGMLDETHFEFRRVASIDGFPAAAENLLESGSPTP